jgi:hypothetical protein
MMKTGAAGPSGLPNPAERDASTTAGILQQ